MKNETFTSLHVTLNSAALMVAIYAALHWGAFMAIRKAGIEMAPAMQSACQAVKGCKRIEAGYRWSDIDKEFASEAVVVQNRICLRRSGLPQNCEYRFPTYLSQMMTWPSYSVSQDACLQPKFGR